MPDPGDLNCREFVELVTDNLEGALPSDERARFEAHLDECDPCTTYVEEMRLTIRALRHLSEDDIAQGIRERLLAEFRDWKRAAGFAPG